jgi:hypothetical protein
MIEQRTPFLLIMAHRAVNLAAATLKEDGAEPGLPPVVPDLTYKSPPEARRKEDKSHFP